MPGHAQTVLVGGRYRNVSRHGRSQHISQHLEGGEEGCADQLSGLHVNLGLECQA